MQFLEYGQMLERDVSHLVPTALLWRPELSELGGAVGIRIAFERVMQSTDGTCMLSKSEPTRAFVLDAASGAQTKGPSHLL
jgi:hypothetical protein